TEVVAVVAAMVVLLVSFGSVIAMGLPLMVALFALGSGISLLGLFALVVGINRFAPQMAMMIGLAVAIDYALLIVTRHRQGLAAGLAVEDSIATAIATAGRTVIFAGATVAIAVLGLYLIGIPTIATVGMTTSIILVLTVVASVTLLPALLSFAGQAIDRFHIPKLLSREVGSEATLWFRLSRAIQRRPWPFALASLGLLVLLASPVIDLRLGSSDAGNNPTSFTSRRAYDLLTEGFGPGFNGPLLVAVDLAGDGDGQAMERLREAMSSTPDVATVSDPRFNEGGDTAVIMVTPASSPQSKETDSLVHRLRDDVIPAALAGSEAEAFVGGQTAAFIDIGQKISQGLPIFMGAVIGLSMILLLVMFRSLLIPLKAAVMNLLSIGAAFGVIVAVFQWGWGAGLIGVKNGPVESFIPMMMFAILFGLSMDYEMFLLSRIREEYLRTRDSSLSVSVGLASTARVITSAATVMVAVFLSFLLGDNRVIKLAGLGLATAIFLDATVIRMMLVPSVMNLLGEANWWLPPRLDRFIPRIAFERPFETAPEEAGVKDR
ncbi:MAG TPA: MMPL family transporter, partial [Dehalococcoidia bacterium]|nr:MMPL family transporter [Dehalococcoidia bacterium]